MKANVRNVIIFAHKQILIFAVLEYMSWFEEPLVYLISHNAHKPFIIFQEQHLTPNPSFSLQNEKVHLHAYSWYEYKEQHCLDMISCRFCTQKLSHQHHFLFCGSSLDGNLRLHPILTPLTF